MPPRPRDDGGWTGGGDWRGDGQVGGSYEAAGGGGMPPSSIPGPARPSNPSTPVQTPPTTAPTGGDAKQKQLDAYVANTDWADTNISKEQWNAWKDKLKDGCPPNLPFESRKGANGETECAAKPDDCPEGQHLIGNDAQGTAKCVGNNSNEGGGGGGGAAAGTGTPAAPAAPAKTQQLVKYDPTRASTYGGGVKASTPFAAPQMGAFQSVANPTVPSGLQAPKPSSQQILQQGVNPYTGQPQPGLDPTKVAITNSYHPGSLTTGAAAVARPEDTLLWPTGNFGGL